MTVAPEIRLLFASRAVMVIVLVPVPASIDGGEAETVVVAAETAPTATLTVALSAIVTEFSVPVMVAVPGVVEVNVAV
ncbi:hypothetical protein D3C83_224440 [compost metagenome]